MMNQVYFGNFESREDVEQNFNKTLADDIHILFATYSYEDYDGHAYVLFEQGSKLFENAGSHCSCYGLEDQWYPNETTPAAARTYLEDGNWYVQADDERAAVLAALDAFERKSAA